MPPSCPPRVCGGARTGTRVCPVSDDSRTAGRWATVQMSSTETPSGRDPARWPSRGTSSSESSGLRFSPRLRRTDRSEWPDRNRRPGEAGFDARTSFVQMRRESRRARRANGRQPGFGAATSCGDPAAPRRVRPALRAHRIARSVRRRGRGVAAIDRSIHESTKPWRSSPDLEVQPHQRSAREGIRLESLSREVASDSTLVQRKTVRIIEVQKPRNGARNMSLVGALSSRRRLDRPQAPNRAAEARL